MLSFDSRSIKTLLSEKHEHWFASEYPIFYKTRDIKGLKAEEDEQLDNKSKFLPNARLKSAIDTALEANQIIATNLMIDYIIKHQNNYVYSFLFEDNLVDLLQKGINISGLLNSDIFFHRFDFESWPAVHHCDRSISTHYNDSIFNLRHSYEEVFKDYAELLSESSQGDDQRSPSSSMSSSSKLLPPLGRARDGKPELEQEKVYKIQYSLNILPSIRTQQSTIMHQCGQTEELELFECDAMKDLIEFKWTSYARAIHYIGFSMHMMYFVVYSLFCFEVYVYQDTSHQGIFLILMAILLLYPLIYDMTQFRKSGIKVYLSDMWNYSDQCHIWLGYSNIVVHQVQPPHWHSTKFLSIIVTFFLLIKTFFFLRIFGELSYLVTMMKQVVYDLKVFMIFYFILIWIAALILNIIELGNFSEHRNVANKKLLKATTYPGIEYKELPKFLRQVVGAIRISLGDFDFSESTRLESFENIIYWVTWITLVITTCIVFLNFIIAEVSLSYEKIKEKINGQQMKERVLLIKEAEDMMFATTKEDKKLFPRYLVTREVEE